MSTEEEDFYLNVILSQLVSDGSSGTLLKAALDSKDLNFTKRLPFRGDQPFRYNFSL